MEKKLVFAIAREFGSGGHEIGLGLSKALGIDFYDKEILKEAAKKSGIVEEMFERADEKPTSSLLYTLSMGAPLRTGGFLDYSDYITNDKLFLLQSEAIKSLADEKACVIIGRCADYILRSKSNLIRVYIHCPLELRIQRIAKLYNIDEDAARQRIKKTDKSRANYYRFYTENEWGNASNYDICLNSEKLGVEGSIETLKSVSKYF